MEDILIMLNAYTLGTAVVATEYKREQFGKKKLEMLPFSEAWEWEGLHCGY